MSKNDDLIDRLGLTRVKDLDSSKRNYVSKLEEGYENALRIHWITSRDFLKLKQKQKKYYQLHKVAETIADNFREALMDLTKITPLNQINYFNPHNHYFVERESKLYETCSHNLAYFSRLSEFYSKDPATLSNLDLSIEAMESFVLNYVPKMSLKRLKAKSIKETNYWFNQHDSGNGQVNLYAVTNPSNLNNILVLGKAEREHYRKHLIFANKKIIHIN